MLEKHDHLGYIVRDLDTAVAKAGSVLGYKVTREYELPHFSLRGAFLECGGTLVELFEILTSDLAEPRLLGFDAKLDHVAYEVSDLDRTAARLRGLGVRFSGPDGREIGAPIELAGRRHLWTTPGSGALSLSLQLIEGPALSALGQRTNVTNP